ncbi:hypothetical protein GCM10012280_60850 [Wenjunlia tyrosinilytica]|uniref:Uncharacterized protein n=1 Tax=Wenjunlia tyrosinilytica TaxID=1544741 RepID=A0A917ZX59_9ACTN|nr:hypothetical protein GCM10012280_60850 [Wenjunlia tyrosinilytica]
MGIAGDGDGRGMGMTQRPWVEGGRGSAYPVVPGWRSGAGRRGIGDFHAAGPSRGGKGYGGGHKGPRLGRPAMG